MAGYFCVPMDRDEVRAVSLHLARSDSQSQRGIWSLLPAHRASHIIKQDTAVNTPTPQCSPITPVQKHSKYSKFGINTFSFGMVRSDSKNKA